MKCMAQTRRLHPWSSGFSLVELLIAMAVTLVVLGGAVLIFRKSMDTNDMTTNMAEMQANARAASKLLAQDISQAGTQITWGGITLPKGGGAGPENFGTDPNYLTPNTFFNSVMYGITPIPSGGPTIGGKQMDGINLIYADPILSSNNPNISNWTTTAAASVVPAGASINIVMPPGMKPAVLDANSGIVAGDILFLKNGNGEAVGVVSQVSNTGVITLDPGDVYNINQFGAGISGNVTALAPGGYPNTFVMRLNVITYFLQGLDAAGQPVSRTASATDYRLMRQVNQQQATVVAEHVDYLQFFYDLADQACPTNPPPPLSHIQTAIEPPCGTAVNGQPAYDKIRNVYINLAARSAKADKTGGYYHSTINTSISPRSLSYNNIYPPDKN